MIGCSPPNSGKPFKITRYHRACQERGASTSHGLSKGLTLSLEVAMNKDSSWCGAATIGELGGLFCYSCKQSDPPSKKKTLNPRNHKIDERI